MENGIGDRWRDADQRDLAEALHAERVHVRVVLVDEDHVHDRRRVGVHRHGVFGEIGIGDAPVAGVDNRVLHEGHADAADHAADALAARDLRVDDAAGTIGADHAPHARLAEIGIDGNLHEHGAKGVHGKPLRLISGSDVACCLDDLAETLHGVFKIVGAGANDLEDAMKRLGQVIEATGDVAPGDETKRFSMHAFGAVFVEVAVDPDLGETRVRRMVGAYGAGRVVNPKIARSQCIGGMIGGIGMALMEHSVVDPRNGRVTNANLAEYAVPVHADAPPVMDVIFVDEHDPHVNPLGVKGLGEIALVGVAPAIANAIFHATGKRVRELPITPDKLL